MSTRLTVGRLWVLGSLVILLQGCQAGAKDLPPLPAAPPPRSLPDAPVPTTFDEAVIALRQRMPAEALVEFRRARDARVTREYYDSLGLWIRNNWGLWDRGPLYRDIQRHGMDEPEEMSALLLSSVWRQLHEEPMTVAEHIAAHRTLWPAIAPPPPPPVPSTLRK